MRILHINCNYTGTTLHQIMIEKLDELGYDNSVFVPTYDKTLSVVVPRENVLVCECFKKNDRLLFDRKQNKICRAIERNYNVKEFDLIHAYTLFTDGNCARILSEKYGIPYVVSVRNTDINFFFHFMLHLRSRGVKIMLQAKAVIFLSEAYRRQVFEKYVPEKYHNQLKITTHIIPNGIDDFWLENAPENENTIKDTIKLIYAGRIDRNKNITTTQKAMRLLRKKGYDVTLTVVGKVVDKKAFSEIQTDPYTRCLPALPKEELLNLYRKHNIFVMPSFAESFGLVYAEAMSQGLPVIYSKGQGFDEQFSEGMAGYHVSAYDAQEVADGIERIINDFDKIKQNVVMLAKKFNWREISAQYEDTIYKKIDAESRE